MVRAVVAPRRYADLPPMSRLAHARTRATQIIRSIAALPREIRDAPPLSKDTGAGRVVRRERDAWVVRPASGWRAHFGRPLYASHELRPDDNDAATEWALRVIDRT